MGGYSPSPGQLNLIQAELAQVLAPEGGKLELNR